MLKERIELVQSTFKKAQEKVASIEDLNELNDWLQQFPNEFISVAYEGASMALALKNLRETNSLEQWKEFNKLFGEKHSFQIHVGLGWAFSILNVGFEDVKLELNPSFRNRVLDGYGYFEGTFKRRISVRTQQVPAHLNELELKSYNQGLGRSLWYIAQGEVEKLVKIINLFAVERLNDLWRGVGIAVTYVGGVTEEKLEELLATSGEYSRDFKGGVGLLIHSRSKANTISTETERISNLIFGKDCETINQQMIDLEKGTCPKDDIEYYEWINNTEKEICI